MSPTRMSNISPQVPCDQVLNRHYETPSMRGVDPSIPQVVSFNRSPQSHVIPPSGGTRGSTDQAYKDRITRPQIIFPNTQHPYDPGG